MTESKSVTFSVWVNTRGSASNQDILRYDDGDSADGDETFPRNFYLFRLNNTKQVNFAYGPPSGGTFLTSTASIALNTWHHVVAVRDVASDTPSIYIDGVLDAGPTTDVTTGTWETTGQFAMLGRYERTSTASSTRFAWPTSPTPRAISKRSTTTRFGRTRR